jgi:hypothetical protein
MNASANKPPGILKCQRRLGTKTFPLETLMPPFEFSIALRVILAGADMSHPAQADEGLEIPGYKGRTVIRDDLRMFIGESFLRTLQYNFHIGLGHRFADLPVDNKKAVAVQNGTKVVERTGHIDIRLMPSFVVST